MGVDPRKRRKRRKWRQCGQQIPLSSSSKGKERCRVVAGGESGLQGGTFQGGRNYRCNGPAGAVGAVSQRRGEWVGIVSVRRGCPRLEAGTLHPRHGAGRQSMREAEHEAQGQVGGSRQRRRSPDPTVAAAGVEPRRRDAPLPVGTVPPAATLPVLIPPFSPSLQFAMRELSVCWFVFK